MKIRSFLFTSLFASFLTNAAAQFSNLQGGANDPVRAFYSDSSNELYVVGRFTQVGSININQIAIWDGINWSSFGNNNLFGSTHDLRCIIKYNNQIIVGGSFDSIGNISANNIARWNGITWESMGMGFDNNVLALYQYNGELYAGGSFSFSGSKIIRALAKWNGVEWDTVGNLVGDVTSFTEYNNKLIVAGQFYLQTQPGSNMIGFDGSSWDTTFSKFNSTVINVRNINDTLYACGTFTTIPINPSNYLSAFYGNSWHAMPIPSGGANTVTDIIEYHNKKYICGYFTNPPDIGVLTQTGYDSLFDANGFIADLFIFNDKLFIAGQFFQTIAGQNYYCVISYDDLMNKAIEIGNNNSNYLQVYPNPSGDGWLNVFLFKREMQAIEIFNSDGKSIYTTTTDNSFRILLQKGFYIIKSKNQKNEVVSKKIIVL